MPMVITGVDHHSLREWQRENVSISFNVIFGIVYPYGRNQGDVGSVQEMYIRAHRSTNT